jgi:hypothetical protein
METPQLTKLRGLLNNAIYFSNFFFRNSGVKSNILKNDEKIARMVGSIGLAGK